VEVLGFPYKLYSTGNGSMSIRIQSKSGKVYEGELYAIDPVTKSVALKTDASYVILNPTEIAQIKGDLTTFEEPSLAELGLR
jgi:hypothetical protein